MNAQPVVIAEEETHTDLYSAMLVACRAWMEKYHPDSLGMAFYVWVDETLPPVRIPILPEVS